MTTDDEQVRAAILRVVGSDRDAAHEIYADDAVLEFRSPGSGSSARPSTSARGGRHRNGGRRRAPES